MSWNWHSNPALLLFNPTLYVPSLLESIKSLFHVPKLRNSSYLPVKSLPQHVFYSLYLLLGALYSLKPYHGVHFCRLWQCCPTTGWLSPGQCSAPRALTAEASAAVCLKSPRGWRRTEGVPFTSERINKSLLQRKLYDRGIKMFKHILYLRTCHRSDHTGKKTMFLNFAQSLCYQILLESTLHAYHYRTINYTLHKGAPLLSYWIFRGVNEDESHYF